ncbi:putative sporulation transcription regulator WhiA [Coprobacillus sp. CAG:826]|nr:putative sporulation transcription regulator WhiA [Coprobacillus sp. CAG:826]
MNEPTLSFTQEIKEELVSLPREDEEKRAILSAFCAMNGRVLIQNKHTILILENENAKVIKYFYLLIQERYQVTPSIAYRRKIRFDKKTCFTLKIEEKADMILEDLEISLWDKQADKSFVRKDNIVRNFLAGAFLAGGSCNAPQSSNYHLEMAFLNEEMAKYILKLLEKIKTMQFKAKMITRRNHFVVYIKKSDQIVNFIAYIGASNSCLTFEEVRVERDFVNNDNRLQICTYANYQKTTSSAKKQLEDIEIIDRSLGISNIQNEKMKILCLLRRENEDASMQELAELLQEEIEKFVSKSSINHLFRAIHELAEKYRGSQS